MRSRSIPKTAAAALVACAVLAAAYSAAAALANTIAIAARLERLDAHLGDLDAALRDESAALSGLIGGAAARLETAIADEGAACRAGTRRQASLVEDRLSRTFTGRDELLSDLGLKIDRLGREPAFSGIDAVVKEGRSEGLLLRDISLARTLEEAERLFAAGRYADAAARYAVVVDMLPGDARLRQKRALSLFRANPADSSAYLFIEGELRDPAAGESAEALDALASIAIERQEWAKALDCLDRLVELEPKNSALLEKAGECARYAGDEDRALSYFERARAAEHAR